MASQCMPHLPEAMYDVQADVRPIHNKKLIWMTLVPGIIASLVVFGISYNSYSTTLEERTSIDTIYRTLNDPDRPMECSMLSFKSGSMVTIARPAGGDWDVWSLGLGSNAQFTLDFKNLYWPNLAACRADMTPQKQAMPGSICRKLAADLHVNRTKCDGVANPDTCPPYGCMRQTHEGLESEFIAFSPGGAANSQGRSMRGRGGIRFENVQYDFDTSTPPNTLAGGGLTQMRGAQGNLITADYDCEAKFTEHWCESGHFAAQASQHLCASFVNQAPYSCVEKVHKYTAMQALALAWSNTQMLWAVNLYLLVMVLRRLPGAAAPRDDADGTVSRAANKHVV